MVKLTTEHIQKLYKFTRDHYVEWYDLQTELVDHLANGIEQQWDAHPKRSFDDALKNEFKKFGVFGFMEVVEQRQKALGKRYNKILWTYVKEWFTIPKIALTLSLFLVMYYVLQLKIGVNVFYSLLLLVSTVDLIYTYRLRKRAKQRFKSTGKKWMLEDIIYTTASANMFVIILQLFNFSLHSDKAISTIGIVFYAALFTIAIIISHIVLMTIPSKADTLLKETYPEYKMVTT